VSVKFLNIWQMSDSLSECRQRALCEWDVNLMNETTTTLADYLLQQDNKQLTVNGSNAFRICHLAAVNDLYTF